MTKDKRKSVRRPLRYSAWVALDGDLLHGCVLSDISESGARIGIDETVDIPDHFTLFLSNNGAARRTCRVIWRKPRELGVAFELGLTTAERASLVPKADADKDAAAAPIAGETEPAENS
jgi:PilZ domain-containing protein